MDKDKFISLACDPNHPIHAATAYMAGMENRKPQKGKGWIRAIGFIVALTAAIIAIAALSYFILFSAARIA